MDLRYGSADENVRKRSIQDVILHEKQRYEKLLSKEKGDRLRENDFLSGSLPEYACGAGTEPVLLCPSHAGELAVIYSVNRLAARGIRARCFSPVILLPPGTQEETLRDLMRQICRASCKNGVRIGEVRAEVTDAVTRPVVFGNAEGSRFFGNHPAVKEASEEVSSDGIGAGLSKACSGETSPSGAGISGGGEKDIILAGPVGMEGTYILVLEQFRELQKRFPMSILTRMTGPGINLSVLEAAKAAVGAESEPDEEGESSMRAVPAMVSLGEGGFFTGLWELSKMTGCGLEADLQAVPILQETIEITDYFGINPYVMRSAGSLLIAARNGEKTLQYLRKEGFMAARIGKLRAGRDKIIHNGEDVRYLDRPQTDSLTGWYRNKERDFEHSLEQ